MEGGKRENMGGGEGWKSPWEWDWSFGVSARDVPHYFRALLSERLGWRGGVELFDGNGPAYPRRVTWEPYIRTGMGPVERD